MSQKTIELAARHDALKAEKPDLRIRGAAAELGVSEAELIACRIGSGVVRLQERPDEILSEVETLGSVMALTRNEGAVHERKGIYENPQFHTHGKMKTGLFVNPDIDLRLFMAHWKFSFAVSEETKSGLRKSFQFFDKSGAALHKIYIGNKSNTEAYDALAEKFKAEDQSPELELESYPEKEADRSDDEIDWKGFRAAWEGLQDTHDFFLMLRKFRTGREQAFRNIGKDFAYEVGIDAARLAIEKASDTGCEIMVFVGNRGCIQIHTGAVKKLMDFGSWFNIMDPDFTLHLDESAISRCWVTRKPTVDGIVTAVEIFDADGEIIATLFGKRKPGDLELELWRKIVSEIPARDIANAA